MRFENPKIIYCKGHLCPNFIVEAYDNEINKNVVLKYTCEIQKELKFLKHLEETHVVPKFYKIDPRTKKYKI
jgi:hypothetical protein